LEGLTRAVEARGVGLPAAGLVGGSRPRVTANLPGDDPADDGMDALPDEVLVAGLGEYPGAPDAVDDGSQLLDLARRDADDAGDGERGARARAALIRDVCVPRRRFRTARRWAQQALGMTVDPTVCAEVLVQVWSAGALLGDAAAAEEGLGRAAALLPPGAPDRTVVGLAALQALVAHDLGRRDLLDRMAGLGRVLGAAPDQQWVLVRMATERGDLAAASKADQVPEPDRASVASRTLRRCASAALAMELGRAEEARELLLEALDFADRTGVTLAAPEAVARLIVLDARTDLPSARRRFEQFEEYVGADTWYPRENVLKLLARAAMRAADGRPDDAAAAASGAADVAERAGLVHLAAQAHRHRAYHHAAAGRAAEARLAATAGSRWRSVAGTTTAVRAPAGGALSLADPDPRAALGLPGRTDGVPGVASA
jgi:tetratricopeptide (TPR) repeat protein